MCNEDDVGGRARVTRDEGVGCNVQKTGEPSLMIYTSYDVFCATSCLLRVAAIASVLKFLMVLIF